MPELPDLQVFSANLDTKLKGRKVKAIEVPVTKKLNVPVKELKDALEGAKVKEVYREGKELRMAFDNKNVLGLHLMLHGGLQLFDGEGSDRHVIIKLLFTDNTGFAMTDWQGAATPTLNPEPKDVPDALSKEVTIDYLKKITQTRSSIKTVLLDQKKIRGIGNAYADEILWDAGISPFAAANKIPDDYVRRLAKSIHSVLTDAEKSIRKKDPDIISGEVRDFLLIHNSKNKTSPDGEPIHHKTVSGRITYYTDEQQSFE